MNKKIKNKIKNKIVDLIKNILLKNPNDDSRYLQLNFDYRYEIWIKNDVINVLAFTILDNDRAFNTCDIQTIKKSIDDAIKEMVSDNTIFDVDRILAYKNNNLFECRNTSIDVVVFANKIYEIISGKVERSKDSWLFLHPLYGIESTSFYIGKEDIGIIHKNDISHWEELKENRNVSGWSPQNPNFKNNQSLSINPDGYNTMLYSFSDDTRYKANEEIVLRMRKLISLIFAIIYGKKINVFRSRGIPLQYGISFGKKHGYAVVFDKQNELLPKYSFGMNQYYELTNNDIDEIKSWYAQYHKITLAESYNLKNRIDVCGHFINLAMNSEGVAEFVNYFTALDAVFGVQGNTGESIKAGILSILEEKSTIESRIGKLYELRNELVHGGIRFIQEWGYYRSYCDNFKIAPEKDIRDIAFKCFFKAPLYSPQRSKEKYTFSCRIAKLFCAKYTTLKRS